MVASKCCVPDCPPEPGVRFRFPHPYKGKQRFEKWLRIINNPVLDCLDPSVIYKNRRLCARHFTPECFIKHNKLKYSAIPTLHVPDPEAAKDWNYSESTDYQPCRMTLPTGTTELEKENVDNDIKSVESQSPPSISSVSVRSSPLPDMKSSTVPQLKFTKRIPVVQIKTILPHRITPESQKKPAVPEGIIPVTQIKTTVPQIIIPVTQIKSMVPRIQFKSTLLQKKVSESQIKSSPLEVVCPVPQRYPAVSESPAPFRYTPVAENLPVSQRESKDESPITEVEESTETFMCRVCLTKTENGVPLNYSTIIQDEESRTLSEIINECCNVKVSIGDKKPQSICIECAEKARAAYEFMICCKKSEQVLQKVSAQENDEDTISYFIDVSEFEKIEKKCDGPKTLMISPTKNINKQPVIPKNASRTSNTPNNKNTKYNKWTNANIKQKLRIFNKCSMCRFHKPKPKLKYKARICDSERQSNTRESIICLRCYRYFRGQASFNTYTSGVIRKKRCICDRCGARFANSRNFTLHLVSHQKNSLHEVSMKT